MLCLTILLSQIKLPFLSEAVSGGKDDAPDDKSIMKIVYIINITNIHQVRSQPFFSGKPEGPFYLSCTFIF